MELTAVYVRLPDGVIAFVEELPDARAQAATVDEARELLREAAVRALACRREASERSIAGLDAQREPLALEMAVPS